MSYSKITSDIKISVISRYERDYSNPSKNKYVHSYQVKIENHSNYEVQLLRRHWVIVDSNFVQREVKGDGVIGKQPVLSPGQSHQYSSWCPLQTEIGKMYGHFEMIRTEDDIVFKVQIPEFKLHADFIFN